MLNILLYITYLFWHIAMTFFFSSSGLDSESKKNEFNLTFDIKKYCELEREWLLISDKFHVQGVRWGFLLSQCPGICLVKQVIMFFFFF